MKYISTRGGLEPVGFSDAVMMGLARDGGLILPESIPDVSARLSELSDLTYTELCVEIMKLYVDLPDVALQNLVEKSYSCFRSEEVTPVVEKGGIYILELFHGPTLAFKDVALQFLGNLFEYIMKETGQELNILGATSGDTGSAAIAGVRGKGNIRIFVMHPNGKVSDTQKLQMTTVLDDNVFNIAVDGTFDDCQAIMKEIFGDLAFKDELCLGSVNSINWSRVLAQVIYYFYAGLKVMKDTGAEKVRFGVPTGNFGDIFAGFIAARMGLPVGKLVLAANENDILSRFFNTGEYKIGEVRETISPSMDIQVASNFERYLYYRTGEDPARLVELMTDFAESGSLKMEKEEESLFVAGSGTVKDTLETINQWRCEYDYLLDPHTAVGVHVASRFLDEKEPMICLATAHPAKFSEAITRAVGEDIAHHPIIDDLEGSESRCATLPASVDEVKKFITEACKS
jgi:threonine synthase